MKDFDLLSSDQDSEKGKAKKKELWEKTTPAQKKAMLRSFKPNIKNFRP